MNSTTRATFIVTAAGLAVVCLVAALQAQPQTAESAAATSDPTAPAVLGGPKIADKTERLTLVQRDSAGKLVRPDDRPEVVALPMLKLSGDAKKAADKIVNEHGTLIAKALNEHQALFLQIQSARQSGGGDVKSAGPQIRELHQKAPELFEPTLLDKLTRALPVDKAAQLRSIVTEYFIAIADEPGPDGRAPRRSASRPVKEGGSGAGAGEGGMMQGDNEGGGMMMQGEGMQGGPSGGGDSPMPPVPTLDALSMRRIESNLVLREMARSLKTLTEMRREQTDRLLTGLGLTPEQDAKIRDLIREAGRKAKDGQPSPEDHRALIEEIKKLLTVEQQKQLQQNLRNR